ncbi:hypothetical protein FIBSPDRAFT_901937 [Athelia psychrophila]|uniref:Uncharacterized protein n=1 Tax=Athelia psychrophila TaxID=1759441 RepID=A0A165WCI5_9AGAM|nr:hypothetical protein FIBSPDRAFT_901937 [Fibularhizoctonia sp. CBS 109695]
MPKDVTPKDTTKSKAQLPQSSPQPRHSARLSVVATMSLAATSSAVLQVPAARDRSTNSFRSPRKTKSTVLTDVTPPIATTSLALQVPQPLFVTKNILGRAIVNNVVGDQYNIVYEVKAT